KSRLKKINSLQTQYKNTLQVIGVHMPRTMEDKNINNVRANIDKYQLNHSVAVDNKEVLTHLFKTHTVPSYYLFDYEGMLRYYQTGAGAMGLLERRIHRFIQRNNLNG